jgi:hypothetical protein
VDVFETGSAGLGVLLSATGVGALLGALAITYFSESRHHGVVLFGSGLLLGLTIAAFALAPSMAAAVPVLFVAGACSSVAMSLCHALLMANTASAMHGRVMSAYMLTFALFPLGVMPASALAEALGPRAALAVTGLLMALLILGVYLFSPSLRRLR